MTIKRKIWFAGIVFLAAFNYFSTGFSYAGEETALDDRVKIAVNHIRAKYQPEEPGAAYAILKDGEIIAVGAVGKADIEWGLDNALDTVFRLGSISKTLTAVAVLQLVEKGLLDLDTPVSSYAPDLPDQFGVVTLRQLLSHRSGLAEHAWNPDILPFIWQPVTTGEIIEVQKTIPVDFPQGEKYAYSNFNYVLVPHIIEQVTGKSYRDFINEQFDRQSMKNSHYDWHDTIIINRAEFYDQKDGVVLNAQDVDLNHISAAGALMSSALDMAHWAGLLLSDQLITRASRLEAWTPKPLPDGTPTKYGLGFNIGEIESEEFIWHNGLTPGSQSAMGFVPEKGLFVVILSNGFYLPNTTKTLREVISILLTGEPPVPEKP